MSETQDQQQTQDAEQKEIDTKQYLNFLVLDRDMSLAKYFQSQIKALDTKLDGKETRVFPGGAKEKLVELAQKYTFYCVVVEYELFRDSPQESVDSLRESLKGTPNADIPIVIAGIEVTDESTKRLLKAGINDVLIRPFDTKLLIQKLGMLNPKDSFLKEPELFTMQTKSNIDLAFQFETSSISEFNCQIFSASKMELGFIVSIYLPMTEKPIMGIVRGCTESGDGFQVDLHFQAISPGLTQTLRKYILNEYQKTKQAA